MKALLVLAFLSVLLWPGPRADEWLLNGDFEQDLSIGWQQEIVGGAGTITRSTTYDPDPDYEVRLLKTTGTGYVWLYQSVWLPDLGAVFSAAGKIDASATSTAWAAAGFLLEYLGDDDSVLGKTFLGTTTRYCPWENSPMFHIIDAIPGEWVDYSFVLGEELQNLPGVDTLRIRRVRVGLLAEASDC